MIKFDKKQLQISLIVLITVLMLSSFLFLFFKEKSELMNYSETDKYLTISLFDKILKKNTSKLNLLDNDPKTFSLNRNVNKETDVLLSYNEESKKVEIATVQDSIYLNGKTIPNNRILLKEIPASYGDVFIFGNNQIEVSKDLKNVYKLKDLENGIEIEKNSDDDKKNIQNLISSQNYSFEEGLWNKTIDICEKLNDDKSNIKQSIHKDCTDGKQCILISSDNNTACTSNLFTGDFKKDKTYSISFDYKQIDEASKASALIIIMGASGQNAYYTVNLSPENTFKTFAYDFTLTQEVAGIIIKLNVTGNDKKESSIVFDNIRISDSGKIKFDINLKDLIKDNYYGEIVLSNTNEFKAVSINDSEPSNNIFDYFLTIKNPSLESSFIQKINTEKSLVRLFVFLIFVSSLLAIAISSYLSYKKIFSGFKYIVLKISNTPNVFIGYIKNKYIEIKSEKKWIIILKILITLILPMAYLLNGLFIKHDFNVLSFFALFYGLFSILFVIESRVSATFALIYLVLCPTMLMLKKEAVAEGMAVQVFYFLVITVVTQIREIKKDN